MYQSIALASEAVATFEQDYSKWLTAVNLLSKELEIIVKDQFPEEVIVIIEEFNDPQISALFLSTIFPVFTKIKKANMTDYLELAERSQNKILISDDDGLRLSIRFNKPDTEINICTPMNYTNPTKEDKVANPRNIQELEPNEEIDPENVLFPYLKISNEIEIQDPYPPVFRTHGGEVKPLPIWNDMLLNCPNSTITLITHSDRLRQRRLGGANYNISETEINNALVDQGTGNVSVIFSDTFFQGRPIKTDQFFIQIEHGLGMFKKQNDGTYINHAGQGASITITHRD